MALLKNFAPPAPGLWKPPQGWTLTKQAQRPRMSHKPPRHSPRHLIPNPTQLYYFGGELATYNHEFMAMAAKWWKDQSWPGGYALFNAYAAANPVRNYWGKMKTLNGHQWFTWYQRAMLTAQFGPLPGQDVPPVYMIRPAYDQQYPFPDYPRAPYPGDPDIELQLCLGLCPSTLKATFDFNVTDFYGVIQLWAGHAATGYAPMIEACHVMVAAWTVQPGQHGTYELDVDLKPFLTPFWPGQHGRFLWRFVDMVNQMPGDMDSLNIVWED